MEDDVITEFDNRDLPIIGGRGYHRKRLDGKLCFELWVYRGSLRKASLALEKEHNKISSTGKLHEPTAIAVAAKKYILWNEKEARATWEDHYGKVSDEIWFGYILRIWHYLSRFSREKIQQWKDDHPEIEAFRKQKEANAVRQSVKEV